MRLDDHLWIASIEVKPCGSEFLRGIRVVLGKSCSRGYANRGHFPDGDVVTIREFTLGDAPRFRSGAKVLAFPGTRRARLR